MELSIVLACSVLSFLASFWLFFVRQQHRAGIWLLVFAALLLRLYMALIDPFLHDWDERFHALVAKNMLAEPFKPMLRVEPLLPYDYTAWCCNHIWLHKQPLFLWQMAFSMKIFGIHEWAIRIPSAVLSALMTFWIYRIAAIWTDNLKIAFLAGLLCATSYYQLELTAGVLSLDHNDLVFTTYVTAGIWAFMEYTRRPGFRWALIAGLFVGLAILVKWLTALVVFGGAGLYLLSQPGGWRQVPFYKHWIPAFGLALAIMAPWQLYILEAFPKESAWSYEYNFKHISEQLGAFTGGDPLYHFKYFPEQYGIVFSPFLLFGVCLILFSKKYPRHFNVPMVGMAGVVFGFFSFVVQTKMPAFTFPVTAVLLILIAIGLESFLNNLLEKSLARFRNFILFACLISFGLFSSQYWNIQKNHSSKNPDRQAKINNTRIFKNLDQTVPKEVVVFNCKSFEDTELMFYQNHRAYHWFPEEKQLDSLLQNGYKIAAFQSHTNQGLPEYMTQNPEVQIIPKEMK